MKLFLILRFFLKEEIKINFKRLKSIYVFFLNFSIFRYFLYLINNSFVPSKDKIFRNYILKNSQKWRNRGNPENSSNKSVLITNIVDHPGYTLAEIFIGKSLMEIFNADGVALLNNYDLKKILLYKSFGIKKIIILRGLNIFVRLKYFIRAYLIIKSCKNMDEFLKFKINNVEIGKTVYDHYVRHSGIGTTNEFKTQFYVNLSKSLLIYYQINKFFKKYKIVASVQSEKQFIPASIIFQSALINKINVYSRNGPSNTFAVRKYTNIDQRYSGRGRFSKKLYDIIINNIKKEAVQMGEKIVKRRFDGLSEYQVRNEIVDLPEFTKGKEIRKIEKKSITKEDFFKRMKWNNNFPIGVIFSSDLTDGVFESSWALFRDRLTWLIETLHKIKKINNVYWLVKPHPNDEINKVITSTISKYEKICSNCNHIKLFPNDIIINSILEFIDVVVTQNGSAGAEYPCFGIPAILSSESNNSGFGYTIEPRSKEEYFFQLQNINKLKKLNNHQIELAKIYQFIPAILARIPVNLMAPYENNNFNEKSYWKEMTKLLDQYEYEEDLLKKMMKIQEANNDMHTIDYRMIKKRNLENSPTNLSKAENL